jgi:hypothetical protein
LGAIAAVFTINYVAEMLGEDEDWRGRRAACTSTASVRMT